MDTPISTLTSGVFSGLLETQTRLRDEAERKWQSSREFIHSLARQVAATWLDEKQRAGLEIDQIPLDELQGVVRERILALSMQNHASFVAPDSDLVQNLKEANRLLQAELEKANLERQAAQHQLAQLQQEFSQHRQSSAGTGEGQPAGIDFDLFPNWYQDWARGNPERDGVVLQVICETGLSRQPEIFNLAASRMGVQPNSGALKNAVEALVSRGFISVRKAESHSVGQPPNLITLTPLGEAAYIFFAKTKPKPGELDLAAHKNEAHALLVLKAADWLKKAGYNVLRQGERIPLEGGHLFCPDITAEKNGKTIYVEVERESTKGNQNRETKWRNFFAASGGDMYIFCENASVQEKLIQEINRSLREKLPQASLRYCDLGLINDEILAATGSIWTSARRRQA